MSERGVQLRDDKAWRVVTFTWYLRDWRFGFDGDHHLAHLARSVTEYGAGMIDWYSDDDDISKFVEDQESAIREVLNDHLWVPSYLMPTAYAGGQP